jgi:hypothetical protein
MVLVLSQYIGMSSSYSTCISVKVCFIQRNCVQHVATAIYSASSLDRDTDDFFFLSHDTKNSPRKNASPLVFHLSSIQYSQSASVWAIRDRSFPFGYHNPKSYVPLRYLKILFIGDFRGEIPQMGEIKRFGILVGRIV